MIAHHDEMTHILKELQADPKNGFSDIKVQERLSQYGKNKLLEKKKKTNLQRFVAQFKDVMILILIAAAAISFVIAVYESHGFFEPMLILLIVFLNAVHGVMQESKAEKALEATEGPFRAPCPHDTNGRETMIEASELVPGDIILLEAGDFVSSRCKAYYICELEGRRIGAYGRIGSLRKRRRCFRCAGCAPGRPA